jgi:hypothetical protein
VSFFIIQTLILKTCRNNSNFRQELQSEQKLYQYQDNLKSIQQLVKRFEDVFYNSKLDFIISSEKLSRNLVGELNYQNPNRRQSIQQHRSSFDNNQNESNSLESLKNEEYKQISINVSPYEMCILPNNNIISSNIGSVTLFDENFNQIKKVEISLPVGCALSPKNSVFISDYNNHCIYKMDFNLNKLKTIGSFGYESNQFKNPLCICCENNCLYVCDNNNYRIKILNLDLEPIEAIKLSSKPYSVKASKTTICIQCAEGTFFYDLLNKSLKKHYESVYGRISYFNSMFCVSSYDESAKKIYFYDNNGQQVDELSLNRLSEFITEWADGLIISSKNKIFISTHSGKKILKF